MSPSNRADDDVAEAFLAQVDAVGEGDFDGSLGPGLALAGAQPLLVETGGDGLGAEPVGGVQVEDPADDGGLGLVGDELVELPVEAVAERAGATGPQAFGGLAFHAAGDAVDDGLALELGEHAEHLHQHASHGGGGVEGFGGRAEHDLDVGQVVEQGGQVAQAAGEPVHAVRIAVQALDGLDHAHRRKIVSPVHQPAEHPARRRGAELAKVTDFGLAKAFDQARLGGLSRTGTVAGKPVFMPRQQIINFKHAQPDADLWALAACLYWALTGAHPRDFPADKDPWQIVLQTEPVPIRNRDRAIPDSLAQVIDHALRDHPASGFTSASDFRRALDDSL